MRIKPIVIATVLAFAASVQAAESESNYAVVSVGNAKVNLDKSGIDNQLVGGSGTIGSSNVDERDTGYKLTFGHQYNRNFALEIGYVDLGKAKYSATRINGETAGSASAQVKATGWTIEAVGFIPVNQAFSVFGKVGTIMAIVEADGTGTLGGASAFSTKSTKMKATYGAGATYKVNNAIGVRAEYENFQKLGDDKVGKSNVHLASVGFVFTF
jgi:OOP family OmpA-OmpF porin